MAADCSSVWRPGPRADDDGEATTGRCSATTPREHVTTRARTSLGKSNVSRLKVLWQQPTPAVVPGTPAVVGGTVFDGDAGGNFYAIDAAKGKLRWKTTIDGAAFTASPIVLRGRVVIGDQKTGTIYGLDTGNGRVLWQIRPNAFGRPAIWGSGAQVGKYVAIGVASNDEGPPPPFLSKGSLVLLDPHDGSVVWQTFTISDADYANGSTGASIWTTPVFDESSGTIYVGTGNNFTDPATNTSDAIMAFDARTGAIKWVNQRTVADVWTPVFPTGPDFDFGDSPQLYTASQRPQGGWRWAEERCLSCPRRGHRRGDQCQAVRSRQLARRDVHRQRRGERRSSSLPATTSTLVKCALIAMTGDATTELWRFETSGLEANGVAVANDVVYFKPSSDPNLYAFDMTGTKLAAIAVGGSNSGVADFPWPRLPRHRRRLHQRIQLQRARWDRRPGGRRREDDGHDAWRDHQVVTITAEIKTIDTRGNVNALDSVRAVSR